jgi:hypothetical protein
MSETTLFSIVESPAHPDFSTLYKKLGIRDIRLNSIRKANAELKKHIPDLVVAEFIYGYGSNYSGVHISNLDVFLVSLLKYKATARVIVMVDKSERQYVDKLNEIYPIDTVLQQPVQFAQMQEVLAENPTD